MSKKIDLTGDRFGRLKVIREYGRKRKEVTWLCQCDCGNQIVVNGYALRRGTTKSCGCYMRDQVKKSNKKHGLYDSRIHTIYYNMRNRCYNPNYYLFAHYGGKGITICDKWLGENGLINFYNWSISHGYADNLSIDRKDNSVGYSPTNCRWVSMREQQNNRTNNRILTYNNESHTMAEWARLLNVTYGALQQHVKKGNYIEYIERIKHAAV